MFYFLSSITGLTEGGDQEKKPREGGCLPSDPFYPLKEDSKNFSFKSSEPLPSFCETLLNTKRPWDFFYFLLGSVLGGRNCFYSFFFLWVHCTQGFKNVVPIQSDPSLPYAGMETAPRGIFLCIKLVLAHRITPACLKLIRDQKFLGLFLASIA